MLRVSSELLEKSNSETEILFYLDNDDFDSMRVIPVLNNKYPNRVKFIVGERIFNQPDIMNKLYPLAKHDIVFLIGDDIICHTAGWDSIIHSVFESVPDKIMMVYTPDGINNEKLATNIFLHRNWIDALGYVFPNRFTVDYADVWVHDIAAKIGRAYYVPSVYFEHLHPNVGKAGLDQTHLDRLAKTRAGNNREIFVLGENDRLADAAKLSLLLQETK